MSEPQKPLTKFNPSGEEKNLNASTIVVQSSSLKYFIELRTTALIDYMLKIYTTSSSAYTRKSISDWLKIRNKPGFYAFKQLYKISFHLGISISQTTVIFGWLSRTPN